jgi:hypothetical protein
MGKPSPEEPAMPVPHEVAVSSDPKSEKIGATAEGNRLQNVPDEQGRSGSMFEDHQ